MMKQIFMALSVLFLGTQMSLASGRAGGPETCGTTRLTQVKQSLLLSNQFLSRIPELFNSGKRRPLTQDEVQNNLNAMSDGQDHLIITPEIINPLDLSDAIFIINSLDIAVQGRKVEFVATERSPALPRSTRDKLKCGDGKDLNFVFKVSCDMRTHSLETDCR